VIEGLPLPPMAGKIQTETQPDSDILQTSFPHRLGGAYWRSFVNSGEIAIGKNVVSADAAKPDPGASGCTEYGGPENSTAWATRVTGFAHQAQICDVSHGVDSGIYRVGQPCCRASFPCVKPLCLADSTDPAQITHKSQSEVFRHVKCRRRRNPIGRRAHRAPCT
jgi:hypothetical protein